MKSPVRDFSPAHMLQRVVIGAMATLACASAGAQGTPASPTISAPMVEPSTRSMPPRSASQATQQATQQTTQQAPALPAVAPTRVMAPTTVATVQADPATPAPAPAPGRNRPGSAAAIMRAQWQTPEDGDELGRGTRSLLALQVSGAVAGPALPMLGATVDVSYKRYLESFGHAIPEFFQEKVPTNQGS